MKTAFCVTFAGAIGSSKTPIAHYLSCRFNLPILSNDVVRMEVREDVGNLDDKEYERRRDARLKEMAKRGVPFIYDASIDRKWRLLKEKLGEFGYTWFVVSMDLSKNFLATLYKSQGLCCYRYRVGELDRLIKEHEDFLAHCGNEVAVSISDETFKDRLVLVGEALEQWLAG